MSRIGNRILEIPDFINLEIKDNYISISRDKNILKIFYLSSFVKIDYQNNKLKTLKVTESKSSKAQYGTINALINNAIIGLTKGFTKELEIVGVGYKASLENGKLKLLLGFSHPIFLDIPEDIKLELISSIEIKLSSYNKESLGQFASLIRKFRAPEPYKGKGIKYKDEVIIRKAGKTSEGNKK